MTPLGQTAIVNKVANKMEEGEQPSDAWSPEQASKLILNVVNSWSFFMLLLSSAVFFLSCCSDKHTVNYSYLRKRKLFENEEDLLIILMFFLN